MKKTIRILISLTALILMAAGQAAAQSTFGGVVSVDKVNHDFGDIYTDQGPVSCTYTFTNISNKPILLLQAVSSCGCTTTEWTREPIQPGKTGTVNAEFDNSDGPYPFDKTVTVYVSDLKNPIVLHLRGSAHDNATPLKESYTLIIGNMGLKSLEIKAGTLSQRETKSGNVAIANVGRTPMKVEFKNVSDGLTVDVYPNPVPARSVANLTYTIQASRERWGKNWYYATPVIDGREYKATGKIPAGEQPVEDLHFYTESNNRLGIGKGEIGFWAVTKENFAGIPQETKEEMSNPSFTKTGGNLDKSLSGLPEGMFTILLSHDPTHWGSEVVSRGGIPLTLSGHTHGLKVKLIGDAAHWRLPFPGGLYSRNGAVLHVSKGLGSSFAFRMGVFPRADIITLHVKK